MAKVTLNPAFETISGTVGDHVFRRCGEHVYVCRRPDMSGRIFSPAQLAHQARFRQAIEYSQRVRADPALRRPYQLAAQRLGAYVHRLAVADFMHPPVVEQLDLSSYTGKPGDPIVVRARDDFGVTGVIVRLLAAGILLEKGSAAENPPGTGRWVYTAQSAAAPAADLPGNQSELAADKTV